MEEIVERVAQAIASKQLDEGDGLYDWHALTEAVSDEYRAMAQAAISAYEAEKVAQGVFARKLGEESIKRFQENHR